MDGSEIILLHVHRMVEPFYIEEFSYLDPKLTNEFSEAYRDKALSKLRELAGKYFHGQNVRCEAVISLLAGAADEICNFAKKEKCDVIIMGSRGHTVLGSLFVGSVAQRVLLLSSCPVLIVPPLKKASEGEKKK